VLPNPPKLGIAPLKPPKDVAGAAAVVVGAALPKEKPELNEELEAAAGAGATALAAPKEKPLNGAGAFVSAGAGAFTSGAEGKENPAKAPAFLVTGAAGAGAATLAGTPTALLVVAAGAAGLEEPDPSDALDPFRYFSSSIS
jgi:hypothetical protein